VAFSPDKTTLATGSVDGAIKLWDIATGQLKKTLRGHRSWVNSVAYRSGGEQLLSGSSDGTIMIWSTATGRPLRTIDATKAEVRSIAVSVDGRYLAAGLRYGTVKVWSLDDGKEHHVFPGRGDMCAVAFSPDGKLLAGSEGDWNSGGIVALRDVTTGTCVARMRHAGEILAVVFSGAGDLVATGAADNTVRLWKLPPSPSGP
jgi:WD40 repeat protein